MKQLFVVFCLLCVNSFSGWAQRTCGWEAYINHKKSTDPQFAKRWEQDRTRFESYLSQSAGASTRNVITIPVVVHVVYNTSA